MTNIRRDTIKSEKSSDGEKKRLREISLKETYEKEASRVLSGDLHDESIQKALAYSYGLRRPFATVYTESNLPVTRSQVFVDFKKSVMERFPEIVEIEQRQGRFTLWTQRPSLLKALWFDA